MKVIIAGSRNLTSPSYLDAAIQSCPFAHEITEVVCGGATGIDALGDRWAYHAGVPVTYYIVASSGKYEWSRLMNIRFRSHIQPGYDPRTIPQAALNITVASDWFKHGNAAGPIRNAAMAAYADALIAVPMKGARKGTDSMIAEATKRGLIIYEKEIEVWTPPTPKPMREL